MVSAGTVQLSSSRTCVKRAALTASSTGRSGQLETSKPYKARACARQKVQCAEPRRVACPAQPSVPQAISNDVRIKVVGLGGGGGNAVNRMVDGGVQVCGRAGSYGSSRPLTSEAAASSCQLCCAAAAPVSQAGTLAGSGVLAGQHGRAGVHLAAARVLVARA